MNGGADLERRMIVNIGEQRFDKMIEEHKYYIDKTGFIKEWWEYGSTVTLITPVSYTHLTLPTIQQV